MAGLAASYRAVASRIRIAAQAAGREPPVLIAVSKLQPVDAVEALYQLGHRDFGENYVQELVEKAVELERRGCEGIRWHFIGHLQTNKVKQLVPHVCAIHSVDSEKLAREISKRAAAAGREIEVFLQVNVDAEESKSGVSPAEAPALARVVSGLGALRLAGLMCIPAPRVVDPAAPFRELRELEAKCRPATHGALSMGMSDDFEAAIREGATHVRVGTLLFGARPLTNP